MPRAAKSSARAGPTPFKNFTSEARFTFEFGMVLRFLYYNLMPLMQPGLIIVSWLVVEATRMPRQLAAEKRMSANASRWVRSLVIILLGNGLYFALYPYLPPSARHQRFQVDLGTLVDFWFCLIVFGIFELVSYLQSRRNKKS